MRLQKGFDLIEKGKRDFGDLNAPPPFGPIAIFQSNVLRESYLS